MKISFDVKPEAKPLLLHQFYWWVEKGLSVHTNHSTGLDLQDIHEICPAFQTVMLNILIKMRIVVLVCLWKSVNNPSADPLPKSKKPAMPTKADIYLASLFTGLQVKSVFIID